MDLLNNYIYLKVLIEVLDGLEELGEASVQQLVILQIVRRNLRHFSHSSVIYKFGLLNLSGVYIMQCGGYILGKNKNEGAGPGKKKIRRKAKRKDVQYTVYTPEI